jgi:hypothetical protein
LQPHLSDERMDAYGVVKDAKGVVRVTGARLEQFTVMTDFENEAAVDRFKDVVERTGLLKAIRKVRKGEERVYIGKTRVDEYL